MAKDELDFDEFQAEIESFYVGCTREVIVASAWRSAIKVLPLLAHESHFGFWENEDKPNFLYRIFRALDVTACLYVSGASAVAKEVEECANWTVNANETSADIVEAVASAAYSVSALAQNEFQVLDYVFHSIYYAVRAAGKLGIDIIENIKKDIKSDIVGNRFITPIKKYEEFQSKFYISLDMEDCIYWRRVIQDVFESGFQVNPKLIERRLNVPIEIQEKGAVEVGKYLKELDKGSYRLNEARIIILGDKGAGKTSIARKLVNPKAPLPKPEESTPGVDTTSWELEGYDFNVRIWDFAGHTVTHAVHQFFLSERCLYILVCNGRTEEYNRLEYWLSQMQIYGGDSEVIILVNKKDKHDHSVPINKLKQKYPIVKLYDFSLSQDKEQIASFREEIIDYVINHPSWEKQEIPETYYHVKEKLESLFVVGDSERGEERIDRSVFDAIATDFRVEDKEALLRDLHALGISLWYEDIEEVETLVLNPEWISHGIYTVINWVHQQKQHGLSLRQFEDVFKKEKKRYPKKEHEFLFKLMKHYQLAFETKKGNVGYLVIPHLLDEDQPDPSLLPNFNVEDSLMLRYKSEIDLPKHTISRFIVRHHAEIKLDRSKSLVWREGVVLEDIKGNYALVIEDNRAISVSVNGDQKTDFLDRIRGTLNDLFEEFKKQKPELQYRVEAYGQKVQDFYFESGDSLKGIHEVARFNSSPFNKLQPKWVNENEVTSHEKRRLPLYDAVNNQMIRTDQVIINFDLHGARIHFGDITNSSSGDGASFSTGDGGSSRSGDGHDIDTGEGSDFNWDQSTTTFNFENCNIGLQENINELAQLVGEKGQAEEAIELKAIAKAVEEAEECQTPKEVRKKGIAKRLQRFTEELADEKSNLHKAVKGVKNGISIAQDIAKSYNDIAQWCGLPQVPKPFLKKEK